jgi:hypothetical protein
MAIAKELSLDRRTIRNLMNSELIGAQGGMIPQTRSGCATECVPGTSGTGGPATGGNICRKTELTCFACWRAIDPVRRAHQRHTT